MSLRRSAPLVAMFAVLTSMLVACGGDDPYSLNSVGVVCEGEVHEVAPSMVSGGMNKVQYAYEDGDGWTWDAYIGDAGSEWTAIGTTDMAMVVCLRVVSSEVVAECHFEDGFTVTQLANEYDVSLRAAATGEVIDTTTVSAPGDTECGMFILTSDDDDKHATRYASVAPHLDDWLRPHVEG